MVASTWDVRELPLVELPRASKPAVSEAPEFPRVGERTFSAAEVEGARTLTGAEVSFSVEVEDGLEQRPGRIAEVVVDVLGSARGWRSEGFRFAQVTNGADMRVLLASPATTDELCAPLQTRGEVSCRNGDLVVLNVKRWLQGAEAYQSDVGGYRTYLINHEVGHFLGRGHEGCPATGARAPVMLQQTKGLDGCRRDPWP